MRSFSKIKKKKKKLPLNAFWDTNFKIRYLLCKVDLNVPFFLFYTKNFPCWFNVKNPTCEPELIPLKPCKLPPFISKLTDLLEFIIGVDEFICVEEVQSSNPNATLFFILMGLDCGDIFVIASLLWLQTTIVWFCIQVVNPLIRTLKSQNRFFPLSPLIYVLVKYRW